MNTTFKRRDENIFIFLVVTRQRYRKSYKRRYDLYVIRFGMAKNIYIKEKMHQIYMMPLGIN